MYDRIARCLRHENTSVIYCARRGVKATPAKTASGFTCSVLALGACLRSHKQVYPSVVACDELPGCLGGLIFSRETPLHDNLQVQSRPR